MELLGAHPNPNCKKNLKKSTQKFIFLEIELSSLNIEKTFIFYQKKAFLIFPNTEPCTFHPKFEK